MDVKHHAEMERAGKSWSRRILDRLDKPQSIAKGTNVYSDGTDTRITEKVLSTDHGLLVTMLSGDTPNNFALGTSLPHWGGVWIEQNLWRNPLESHRIHIMAHELGHVLLINNWYSYVDVENHIFTGPEAQRVNNGEPVPLKWYVQNDGGTLQHVPPGTPGAIPDTAHPAICHSVMSYCADRNEVYVPAAIDFAFLDDLGWHLLDDETAALPEVYGWGAWGTYSAWGIGVQRTLQLDNSGDSFVAFDQLHASADAFGIAPVISLADNSVLSGTATWSGSLLGVDLGQPMLPPVFGDAELQVNLSNHAGVARFGDLTAYVENQPVPFRAPNLEYNIDVTGSTFSDIGGRVHGSFYGPEHQEMAGVLDDRTPSVNLLGAFCGTRWSEFTVACLALQHCTAALV